MKDIADIDQLRIKLEHQQKDLDFLKKFIKDDGTKV